jgi:alpha-amylase/alpha-mannosidase (GH57 family)
MNRYICIHGHFYQPPRENPWLEEVEVQDSAHPYHDWNERITAECYGPNSRSRILDGDGFITDIVNNYSKMSFNFGPTLLSWMERHHPKLLAAVIEADRLSMERFDGHGSAMAQAFSHMIMPLASRRDKITQVRWGVADFRRRFGHDPEGMWLPETAVDLETLTILADAGIRFTILAPRQAAKTRRLGETDWLDVSEGRVDPTTPYLVPLPDGRTFTVFFYDGPIAQDLAFGDMLTKGETFRDRLMASFSDESRDWPQIVNIATDGETYGHHHTYGEMSLSYCLSLIEADPTVELINYAAYLDRHPPAHEAEIFENSSWSCIHGVERWRADCGCNSGGNGNWHQQWRAPLREAMDWLRDRCVEIHERAGPEYFKDIWEARDAYIEVVNDRSPENVAAFFSQRQIRELSPEDVTRALKVLELQRYAMLNFTSCGWFFDEISGIETVQILRYAARTIQLAAELDGVSLDESFAELLAKAPGNVLATGLEAYEKYAKPAAVTLQRVGAHYAISSLFDEHPEVYQYGCYKVFGKELHRETAGRSQLLTGCVKIQSDILQEQFEAQFAAVYTGDHNVSCGIKPFGDSEGFRAMQAELRESFDKGDLSTTIRTLDAQFDGNIYSLWHLFRDAQRKVVRKVLAPTFQTAEDMYRQIFENNYPFLNFLQWVAIPLPRHFLDAAAFVIETDLKRLLAGEGMDLERLEQGIKDAGRFGLSLDYAGLGYEAAEWVNRRLTAFGANPGNIEALVNVKEALERLHALPMGLNLWKAQNVVFDLTKTQYPEKREAAGRNGAEAAQWVEMFAAVAKALLVRMPA